MSFIPPDQDKIAELRSKGLTDFSPLSQYYFFAGVFLLALSWQAPSFYQAIAEFLKSNNLRVEAINLLLVASLKTLLFPLLLAVVIAHFWGLLQNRFSYNPNLVQLDFARLFNFAPEFKALGLKIGAIIITCLLTS